MCTVTVTVRVPASLPSHLREEVMEALYRVLKKMRRELKVKVRLNVEEEADAFPVPHTFHTFHGHLFGEPLEGLALISSVTVERPEESSDGVEDIYKFFKDELEGFQLDGVVGMSRVGVADTY